MSAYGSYEVIDDSRRHRHRHDRDRRDEREPRYVETQETYVRAPAVPTAPEPKYVSRQTEIIRAPRREDSDLSIEEVRREFPPPGSAAVVQHRTTVRDDRYGVVRSRSAERDARYYGEYQDDRRSERDPRGRRSFVKEEKVVARRRSLSRNQKIIAAVGGAALAVGSKELWDRRQAEGRPVSRNALGTAAIGAAGAFAGYEGAELYAKHGAKYQEKVKHYVAAEGRNGDVAEYEYSTEEEERPKRSKSRRKSLVEGALGLAGLGAAAKATGGSSKHRRRGSADSYYSDRSGRSRRSTRSRRDRSVGPEGAAKFQQAAKAALLAGATEAFRVRKEPGGWGGPKGRRILTAAIGAGGIDAAADRDPDKKSKRHILEAVVGGLAGNRLINGSRNNVELEEEARSIRSRSRSRSRSRGPSGGAPGLAALATAGLGALAGKKLLDRSRSRSRGGGSRRRRDSSDSYDSRSPSPRRGHKDRKRSKSVTDYARKGLAAIGLGEVAEHEVKERRRGDGSREIEETHVVRKSRRRGSDEYDDRRRDVGYARDRGDPYGDSRYADSRSSFGGNGGRSRRQRDGQRNRRVAEGKMSESDTESLGSSSGDEKRIKKMKGKQFLTAGLATVATIHAAHNVYQSMEKRDARQKAVREGEMSPEEARKLKAKATLQDVASVGIAALGIKGALSEIKEANEIRKECIEFNEKKEERHKKRIERQKTMQRGSGSSKIGDGRKKEREHRDHRYDPEPRYNSGPHYVDANPYASSLPAPPVGYYDER